MIFNKIGLNFAKMLYFAKSDIKFCGHPLPDNDEIPDPGYLVDLLKMKYLIPDKWLRYLMMMKFLSSDTLLDT